MLSGTSCARKGGYIGCVACFSLVTLLPLLKNLEAVNKSFAFMLMIYISKLCCFILESKIQELNFLRHDWFQKVYNFFVYTLFVIMSCSFESLCCISILRTDGSTLVLLNFDHFE